MTFYKIFFYSHYSDIFNSPSTAHTSHGGKKNKQHPDGSRSRSPAIVGELQPILNILNLSTNRKICNDFEFKVDENCLKN